MNKPWTFTYQQELEQEQRRKKVNGFIEIALVLFCFFILMTLAYADNKIVSKGYTDVQICEAIYKAEGGTKTRHPYGVLTKYKHTTPRQACINSIKSARKRWNGEGHFIVFLGKTYSPPSINPHWVNNVSYFLKRG